MITITINNRQFTALIDTGSTLSIIDDRIEGFKKVKIKPIYFSTINGKDSFNSEIHTPAPIEFQISKGLVRWRVKNLRNRKYQFIIGIDLLKQLNCLLNLETGYIFVNERQLKLLNNPFSFNEISTLEMFDVNVNLKLDHLNSEEEENY